MFDEAVKRRFEECVSLANAPRASRLLRSPYRVGYSVLAGVLTQRLNFTVRKRVPLFWGREMNLILPEGVSNFLYRFRYFEEDLTRIFIANLTPGMCVFDIGAHYGYMTLLAADLVGATGKVHSFEPTPSTFAVLSDNTRGMSNVILNNNAMYSHPCEIPLTDFGVKFAAFNSLSGGRLDARTMQKINPKPFNAKALSIDSYCELSKARPDMIKIDAEKAEMDILRGAEKTLREIKPMVAMEVGDEAGAPPEAHSRRTVDFLVERGYRIFRRSRETIEQQQPKDWYDADNLLFVPEGREVKL